MPENMRVADPTGILEGHAVSEVYHPNKREREKVSALTTRFDDAYTHRTQWEWSWEFNRMYLRGEQVLAKDLSTNNICRINTDRISQRLLSMENLLRPYGRALVGKLTRIIPSMTVMPATDDESDLRAAQVAETFLEYIDRKENMRVKYLDGQRSLVWSGTAIYQLIWDKTEGRKLSICDKCGYQGEEDEEGAECPLCKTEFEQAAMQRNSTMQQAYQQSVMLQQQTGAPPMSPPPQAQPEQAPILHLIYEGDIKVNRLDIRDIFPEPGIVEWEKLRYVFVRKALPVSEIRRMFPEKGQFVKSQDGIYHDRTLTFFGSLVDDKSASQYLKDHAYLHEYHEVPSQEFPYGRLIYFTDRLILEEVDHPIYKYLGRLPFYANVFEKNEGEIWGESPIDQARGIQRERNRLLTNIREHRELTLCPKLLKPQKTRLGVNEIDTTPGQILEFDNLKGKPSYLEIPQLPQYAYQELARMEAAIRQLFGITEQEIGAARGDMSGRAAAINEAQSSESIAPILVTNNEEWKALYRGILLVAQAMYSKDRTWTVTGKERVRTFQWGDANLNPGWDVALAETDSLSRNPAILFQQATELWDRGFFVDPTTGVNDKRAFMRMAHLKLPGAGPDQEGAERAYAASIPERIARGEQISPRPWDDPFIMVEELVGWLRGPGRSSSDPRLADQVAQWYMFYAQMLPYTPQTMSISPNALGGQYKPNPSGQNQQRPVGNGPGAQPGQQQERPVNPQQQGPVAQEAAQTVQSADRQGENLARMQQRHEG